jgi:hypothetical protein
MAFSKALVHLGARRDWNDDGGKVVLKIAQEVDV